MPLQLADSNPFTQPPCPNLLPNARGKKIRLAKWLIIFGLHKGTNSKYVITLADITLPEAFY